MSTDTPDMYGETPAVFGKPPGPAQDCSRDILTFLEGAVIIYTIHLYKTEGSSIVYNAAYVLRVTSITTSVDATLNRWHIPDKKGKYHGENDR
jgi:hypothetical protein